MKCTAFAAGDSVAYIPLHAHGDIGHDDVERGVVSSVGEEWVFVKFHASVSRLGWESATAQACDPAALTLETA